MHTHYRSIFISDVHLGSRDCKSLHLLDFLKHNTCDTLYLVGDMIDGWKIQQNRWRWNQSHTNVVRKILSFSKKDVRVVYVAGNHDEFLRTFMPYDFSFGNVEIYNQYEHVGADGNRYLVVHGDMFDGINRIVPWISFLGDKAYDFILALNSKFNWIRRKLGFGYWSLSKFLKYKVKQAMSFMFQYELNLVSYCKKRGFDGVICGHVHSPEIKVIDSTWYFNDGDFVESISALVETHEGDWILIHLEENEWRPLQVLDRKTNQIIKGPECIPWFLERGFSILPYLEK